MQYFNAALQNLESNPAPVSVVSYSVTSVFTGRRSQTQALSFAYVNVVDRIIDIIKLCLN